MAKSNSARVHLIDLTNIALKSLEYSGPGQALRALGGVQVLTVGWAGQLPTDGILHDRYGAHAIVGLPSRYALS